MHPTEQKRAARTQDMYLPFPRRVNCLNRVVSSSVRPEHTCKMRHVPPSSSTLGSFAVRGTHYHQQDAG